jgi:hypothetical protein
MPQHARRANRPRTPISSRWLAVRAAGTVLAGAAIATAPAAAQASAAAPAPTTVRCSTSALAAAIGNANRAGTATLLLARGCTYQLTSAATGEDGLPPVTGTITIIGGPGTQISRSLDALAAFRILDVRPSGTLTLVNLTVARGQLTGAKDEGAGILDSGALVLRNVRLTGNTNSGFGGGLFIDDDAQATINGSDLDGNTGGAGGAIFSLNDLAIDHSVLARNTAANGGALFTEPGSATRISRTVVHRNRAGSQGGGILNQGALVLSNDLVTFNQAPANGGGILNSGPGTVTLRSTVAAFNTPDNCFPQGTIAGCRN